MLRSSIAPAALLAVLVGLAACSPAGDELPLAGWSATLDAEGQSVESFALLTATVSWPRARAARREEPVSLRAVFVTHQGHSREALLDVLGLPQLLALPAEDSCVLVTDAPGSGAADAFRGSSDGAWVDLRDAGRLTVRLEGMAPQSLEPQFIPDVVPLVSGVTYAGAVGFGRTLTTRRAAADVRFASSGSGEVGPFDVRVALPAPLRLYSVGGRYAQRGHVRVPTGGDLAVRWDARGSSDEPLLVELSRRSFGAVDTIRCVVADDGAFVVPGALRARLPAHREPATDRLTVRRMTGAEFYANGVDEGWAFAIAEDFVLLDALD
jgi:hypothetical protein